MHQLKKGHWAHCNREQYAEVIKTAIIFNPDVLSSDWDCRYNPNFIGIAFCHIDEKIDQVHDNNILIPFDEFLARLKGEWGEIKITFGDYDTAWEARIGFSIDPDKIPPGEYILTKVNKVEE